MSAFAALAGALPGIGEGIGAAAGGPNLSSSGPAVSGNNTVLVPANPLNAGAIVNALQGSRRSGGLNFGLNPGLSTTLDGHLGSVSAGIKIPGAKAEASVSPTLIIGGLAVVAATFLVMRK